MTYDEWQEFSRVEVERLLEAAPELKPLVDSGRRLNRAWSGIHNCLARAVRARGIATADE